MSRFFIDRPIFASVLSLIITLFGGIALFNLPVAQYPDLTPPSVVVHAQYPGASAEVIAETVSAPLEQKINGVENMIYMTSVASNSGDSTTSVFFEVGTDPDKAMINVNNRVQMAVTSLPEEVRRYGVNVDKKSSAILQAMVIYSDTDKYDATFLGNYALVNIIDEIKRIPGIGDASVLSGNDYSICVWIKPDKMAKLGVTPADIASVIRAQNSQRAAGKSAQNPMSMNVDRSYLIKGQKRYNDAEQFKEILVRANPDGSVLKLKDVADVELGAQSYEVFGSTRGCVGVPMMLFLSPGANALSTVSVVEEKMKEISSKFPEGVHAKVVHDTSGFVKSSIKEVVKTLFEAIFLVFLVIFVFLKDWRATLIPCLAVPVSIIGAFGGMMLFGFSINTLTLFGLVLAIGIVVDDAIVVIENVERISRSEGIPIRDATIKAMDEVTGPVIAIVLVLCSVFVPVAFMGGFTGVMYKQFAITIAISVVISGFVALTLTPALCVILLHDLNEVKSITFLEKFDEWFSKLTDKYVGYVKFFIERLSVSALTIVLIIVSSVYLFKKTPGSLVPDEDQGVFLYAAIMDPASTLYRTNAVMQHINDILLKDPAVTDAMVIAGYDMLGGSIKSSSGISFVKLVDWSKRTAPGSSSTDLVRKVFGVSAGIPDGLVVAFNPPPIVGLSTTGGFEGYIQDRSGSSLAMLEAKVKEFIAAATKRPEIASVTTTFSSSTPQFRLDVNDQKAISMGVNLDDLYFTVQSTFGKAYINDFTKFGRSFKVLVQAKDEYRRFPSQLNNIYVRSSKGNMVPLSELVKLTPTVGPETFERFNVFPAAKILGNPAAGYTSGQSIEALEEVAEEVLGQNYSLSWIGSAYQEKQSSGSSSQILLLGLIVVFLILAAQYEKWSLPFSVISAVPFAAFGAVLAVYLRSFSNDIYFQIALLTLVGLSAKNAILIVEFAVLLRKKGYSVVDAALKAAKLRFRPIIMTSLAFVLGCVPLAISSGAGCASRHSIGTGIIGGMLSVTVIAPLFIPMFYMLITLLSEKFGKKGNTTEVKDEKQ